MQRYLYNQIVNDLKKKMVFLTGPRQVGKTYLARQIMQLFRKPQYLNYDNVIDAGILKKMSWPADSDLLVFDEIHKMKNWKNYIKGVFDSKPAGQSILVTGSARLELFRKTGDSLAGRYFNLRLNPVTPDELTEFSISPADKLDFVLTFGGFPEPLTDALESDRETAINSLRRWENQYYSNVLRNDIMELSRIQELSSMNLLAEMLRSRTGSPLSSLALSEDLQISPHTVKKYVGILENLYAVFLIKPYNRNIARSILKEPKVYFYDCARAEGNEGIKLENLVAVSLLKKVQYMQDVKGLNVELNYLRTRDGREVDFAIIRDHKIHTLIEVKLSDQKPSQSLAYFSAKFPDARAIQIVKNLYREETIGNIEILNAAERLANPSFLTDL